MTYLLIIPGTLPGLNDLIDANRRHWSKGRDLKADTDALIAWGIKWQLPLIKITAPVHINYTWYEPNRKRDKDNIASAKKFIQDAMVKSGLLQGDGWKYITGFTDSFAVDKDNPRVEIEVTEE